MLPPTAYRRVPGPNKKNYSNKGDLDEPISSTFPFNDGARMHILRGRPVHLKAQTHPERLSNYIRLFFQLLVTRPIHDTSHDPRMSRSFSPAVRGPVSGTHSVVVGGTHIDDAHTSTTHMEHTDKHTFFGGLQRFYHQ